MVRLNSINQVASLYDVGSNWKFRLKARDFSAIYNRTVLMKNDRPATNSSNRYSLREIIADQLIARRQHFLVAWVFDRSLRNRPMLLASIHASLISRYNRFSMARITTIVRFSSIPLLVHHSQWMLSNTFSGRTHRLRSTGDWVSKRRQGSSVWKNAKRAWTERVFISDVPCVKTSKHG